MSNIKLKSLIKEEKTEVSEKLISDKSSLAQGSKYISTMDLYHLDLQPTQQLFTDKDLYKFKKGSQFKVDMNSGAVIVNNKTKLAMWNDDWDEFVRLINKKILKPFSKVEKVVKEAKKVNRKKIASWIVSNFDNFTDDWDDSELLAQLGLGPNDEETDEAFAIVSDIVNKMKKAAK